MEFPIVSIIIPVYNNKISDVERCIQSILIQRYTHYEIIIVDDGSDPSIAAFLDSLKEKAPNISVIHQKNKGVSQARNHGVSLAKGKYVTFVDADDILSEHFLDDFAKMYHNLGNTVDIYYGYIKEVTHAPILESGKNYSTKFSYKKIVDSKEFNRFFKYMFDGLDPEYKNGGGMAIISGPCSRIIKKELLLKCPFHDELRIGEDIIWNLELLQQLPSCVIVNSLWYYYIYNPKSAMHLFTNRTIHDCELFLFKLQTLIDENLTIGYLRKEDSLLVTIKNAAFAQGREQDFNCSKLMKQPPWNFAFKWKYIIQLRGKILVKFILLKLGLFDFVYSIERHSKQYFCKIL